LKTATSEPLSSCLNLDRRGLVVRDRGVQGDEEKQA
jgi:hypothetical protein